jgi:hypothetical protein
LTRHVEGDETAGGRGQWESDTRDSKRYAKGRLIADVEGLAGWRARGLEGWRAGEPLGLVVPDSVAGARALFMHLHLWLHGELSKAA